MALLTAFMKVSIGRSKPLPHEQRRKANNPDGWSAGAGGEFLLRIAAPDGYPFQPFAMRLLTPIYHPTVGPAGNVAVLGLDMYDFNERKEPIVCHTFDLVQSEWMEPRPESTPGPHQLLFRQAA